MRCSAAIAGLALALAGCGAGPQLTGDERAALSSRLTDAREAAGANDPDGVANAMTRLRSSVRRLQAQGKISADDAVRLRAEAIQTARRARVELTPTPAAGTQAPTVTPTPPPTAVPVTPAPQGKAKGNKGDHGKKGDKGNGGD